MATPPSRAGSGTLAQRSTARFRCWMASLPPYRLAASPARMEATNASGRACAAAQWKASRLSAHRLGPGSPSSLRLEDLGERGMKPDAFVGEEIVVHGLAQQSVPEFERAPSVVRSTLVSSRSRRNVSSLTWSRPATPVSVSVSTRVPSTDAVRTSSRGPSANASTRARKRSDSWSRDRSWPGGDDLLGVERVSFRPLQHGPDQRGIGKSPTPTPRSRRCCPGPGDRARRVGPTRPGRSRPAPSGPGAGDAGRRSGPRARTAVDPARCGTARPRDLGSRCLPSAGPPAPAAPARRQRPPGQLGAGHREGRAAPHLLGVAGSRNERIRRATGRESTSSILARSVVRASITVRTRSRPRCRGSGPRRRRTRASSARRARSATRVVLPTPASPATTTTWCSPLSASERASYNSACSSSRPSRPAVPASSRHRCHRLGWCIRVPRQTHRRSSPITHGSPSIAFPQTRSARSGTPETGDRDRSSSRTAHQRLRCGSCRDEMRLSAARAARIERRSSLRC